MSDSRNKPKFLNQEGPRNRRKRFWLESLVPLTPSTLLSLLSNPQYRDLRFKIECLGFGTNKFQVSKLDSCFDPFIEHLRSLQGQIIYIVTKDRDDFNTDLLKDHFRLVTFPQELVLPPANLSPEKLCKILGFEFFPEKTLAERWDLEFHEQDPQDLELSYAPPLEDGYEGDVSELIQVQPQPSMINSFINVAHNQANSPQKSEMKFDEEEEKSQNCANQTPIKLSEKLRIQDPHTPPPPKAEFMTELIQNNSLNNYFYQPMCRGASLYDLQEEYQNEPQKLDWMFENYKNLRLLDKHLGYLRVQRQEPDSPPLPDGSTMHFLFHQELFYEDFYLPMFKGENLSNLKKVYDDQKENRKVLFYFAQYQNLSLLNKYFCFIREQKLAK